MTCFAIFSQRIRKQIYTCPKVRQSVFCFQTSIAAIDRVDLLSQVMHELVRLLDKRDAPAGQFLSVTNHTSNVMQVHQAADLVVVDNVQDFHLHALFLIGSSYFIRSVGIWGVLNFEAANSGAIFLFLVHDCNALA